MRISDWSSDVCSSDLIVERRRRLPAQFLDVAPQVFAPKMLPCRDAAAHRADPRRNTLAHGKMDARCERAVGDLDQHRALRGNFPQSLARLELVGEIGRAHD